MSILHELAAVPNRWFRILLGLTLVVLTGTSGVQAGDDVYYANGQAYPLIRSSTELAVQLESSAGMAPVARDAESRGVGRLERLEGDSADSRYRLLRVGAANRFTRDAAGSIPGVGWVRPVYRFPGQVEPMLSTGRAVVRLVKGLSDQQRTALFEQYGVKIVEPFEGLDDTYLVRPEGDPDDDEVRAAAGLQLDGRVVYAHPDFAMLTVSRQVTPDDEFFSRQWHLQNLGQDGATPGADIGVLTAWETTQGEDIRIGMLDDSCDVDHEDLRGNYLGVGQDLKDGDDDPTPGQIGDRHGTSVMGLICARANSEGVRGVAPNARFTASRGLGFETSAETASAYTFARQQNVDVHNNSWGYGCLVPVPSVVSDAIRTAFEDGRDGKGMVVVFSSGNESLNCELDISALPTVIAVGATNAADVRASYSNYGAHLDVMGPSNAGTEGAGLPSIVTTDNTDDAGYAEPGYNNDGFDDFGMPNLSNPDYTKDFGGTSAACPVVSGVAVLVLSVNSELTATQVRLILEHTSEQVALDDAEYDAVTSRSNTYGYGRVNATQAVEAASQSLTNGGFTWPDRVSDVRVSGSVLRWNNGAETKTAMIVESNDVFQWKPTDGESYAAGDQVASGVTVVFKDSEGAENYEFTPPDFGTKYFGIFAQNDVGRFSWGVAVDSDGNVTDAGSIDTGESAGDEPEDVIPINEDPKVSITATPRSGDSPLTVSFQGNALTDSPIASVEWDFGDGTEPVTERDVTHTYEVTDGRSHRYLAKFTVVDEEGDTGSRSVAIDVDAVGGGDSGDGGTGDATVQIVLTGPDGGTEIDSGFAPLEVRVTLDASGLPGEFSAVQWDLGDGTIQDTVTVLHEYATPGSFPIQATVYSCHATAGCATSSNPAGTTYTTKSPVLFVTVLDPGTGSGTDQSQDDLANGDEAGGETSQDDDTFEQLPTGGNAGGGVCGVGLLSVWFGMLAFALLRRWNT